MRKYIRDIFYVADNIATPLKEAMESQVGELFSIFFFSPVHLCVCTHTSCFLPLVLERGNGMELGVHLLPVAFGLEALERGDQGGLGRADSAHGTGAPVPSQRDICGLKERTGSFVLLFCSAVGGGGRAAVGFEWTERTLTRNFQCKLLTSK